MPCRAIIDVLAHLGANPASLLHLAMISEVAAVLGRVVNQNYQRDTCHRFRLGQVLCSIPSRPKLRFVCALARRLEPSREGNRMGRILNHISREGYMGIDNTDGDTGAHRVPSRRRGVERFEALLDATEQLLAERANDDISLADIAERTSVPLASIYHFFPNRNSAFVALAQRFQRALHEIAEQPMPEPVGSWQDIVRSRQRLGADYLNGHPAALRLFMGAGVSVEVRNTDLSGNAMLARNRVAYFNRYFEMPKIPDFEKRVAISIALMDGIWALSYSMHGRITDEYVEESIRASILYLRCYLPEFVVRRAGT